VIAVVPAVVLTSAFVAGATNGRLIAGSDDVAFTSVSIDSRSAPAGSLFVALHGDRFDGHDFVRQATERGATGVLVSRDIEVPAGITAISVADSLIALQRLGRAVRERSGASVVAITGSAGKTSTKEITAELLSAKFRVFRNRGNLNNHIGLPLSLTELASGPDVAVVELGMNHEGEIRTLVKIANPQVRVWTNVGDAHIGHFGSRESVAAAKAEVLELADASAVAVLNADDPLVIQHAARFPGRVVTFGVSQNATIRATSIVDRGFEGVSAVIVTPTGTFNVDLSIPGRAHLMNVLAAVAVAQHFDVDRDAIAARLADIRPVARRGAIVTTKNGTRLVDDTYNASPAAMDAMLHTLAATATAGRKVAVLGEMKELGKDARDLHEQCGRTVASSGVDLLIAVGGPVVDGLAAGAITGGLPGSRIWRFVDAAAAAAAVPAMVRAGDLVLVKGSRSTRTDLIADALVAAEAQR